MAKLIKLDTYNDDRGSLSVLEKVLPFDIKRVYYMYQIKSERGGHRHKQTIQALVAVNGACKVHVINKSSRESFFLDSPDKCLLVKPEDWHTMDGFSQDCVLLVLASEFYNADDYIEEMYE